MRFRAKISTPAYLWIFALLRLGCGQDVFNYRQVTDVKTSTHQYVMIRSSWPSYLTPPRVAPRLLNQLCSAPQQPEFGEWRLHPDLCEKYSADCRVPAGTGLRLGYQLIYNCSSGYRIEGNDTVFCGVEGEWSPIPSCRVIEIQCERLHGISRSAECFRFGTTVDCNESLLPHTTAQVSCRSGYTDDRKTLMLSGFIVRCDENGNWQPPPISCVPACGKVHLNNHYGLGNSVAAWDASIADFPWHATLYKEDSSPNGVAKKFICGATIIATNFVMTAAHCVYDERTEATEDAGRLFIMTGNTFRDYDHPKNNNYRVSESAVKKVNLPFDYYGLRGNYGSDIALLELLEPFSFYGFTAPACLDPFSPDAPILEKGATGRVAGFGKTDTQDSSPTLLTLTAPFVPYNECRAPDDRGENYVLISRNNFCAGCTNGTVVCDGDSGGGLVFEKNNQWYVMGIVSVGLGVNLDSGEKTCARHALSLYTKVSEYIDWIRKVISGPQQSKQSPSSIDNFSFKRQSSPEDSAATISPGMSSSVVTQSPTSRSVFCVAPEQPTNGLWKLHPTNCTDLVGATNCRVAAGAELETGSALVYSCNAGYEARGQLEVYCGRLGSWSNIPECVTSDPLMNHRTPIVPNGDQDIVGELPWQASLYKEKDIPEGIRKEFQCVATIIKANLLLTAKHCVYDKTTNTSLDPKKLFVITGNIHPDYDSPLHNRSIVKKSAVKKFYIHCRYTGRKGNFRASETALLQLEEPLRFAGTDSPPSSELEDYSEALRDLDRRGNILIFRTARGSVVCNNNASAGGLVIRKNAVWHVLRIARASDYSP